MKLHILPCFLLVFCLVVLPSVDAISFGEFVGNVKDSLGLGSVGTSCSAFDRCPSGYWCDAGSCRSVSSSPAVSCSYSAQCDSGFYCASGVCLSNTPVYKSIGDSCLRDSDCASNNCKSFRCAVGENIVSPCIGSGCDDGIDDFFNNDDILESYENPTINDPLDYCIGSNCDDPLFLDDILNDEDAIRESFDDLFGRSECKIFIDIPFTDGVCFLKHSTYDSFILWFWIIIIGLILLYLAPLVIRLIRSLI